MTVTTADTEAATSTQPNGIAPRRPRTLGVLRWEVRKLVAQLRTRLLLLGVVVAPWPIALVISGQGKPPKDTLFGRFATENGFALALLVLGFAAQWALPLLTSIVAGDIFASEDQHGTWKTVLTRSAGRGQIFRAKAAAAIGFAVLVQLVLSASTIAASVVIGGHGTLTGLSGQLITPSHALVLVAASWVSMVPPLIGFTCLAIALSVGSRNPAVGVATPVVLGMVMQLVGALGGVEALRPFLLSTPSEAWHGFLTSPRFYGPFYEGLVTSGAWSLLALGLAFVLLRRRDITGG